MDESREIKTELSAEEVLTWLLVNYNNANAYKNAFGENYSFLGLKETFSPKMIVDMIQQYVSKKEPELEWVNICRIIEIQSNGFEKCVHEEDLFIENHETALPSNALTYKTEEVLKKYISSHDGNYIAVVERVCRVKK